MIVFVTIYCFVPPFQKAKFCGVPSGGVVEVGCAVGKRRLRNKMHLTIQASLKCIL